MPSVSGSRTEAEGQVHRSFVKMVVAVLLVFVDGKNLEGISLQYIYRLRWPPTLMTVATQLLDLQAHPLLVSLALQQPQGW